MSAYREDLKDLQLYNANITSLLEIRNLNLAVNLRSLNLHANNLNRIDGSALAGLRSLTELNLSSNQIDKIEGLESLSSLQVLDLSANKVTMRACGHMCINF